MGPLSREKRCITAGYGSECVSYCCIQRCNSPWRRAHFQHERDVASLWVGYERNALVSVASLDATYHGAKPTFKMREMMLHHWMQHTKEAGPRLHKERVSDCCITGCNTTQRWTHFRDERDVASLDATRRQARFRRRRDVASP